jgi:mannosyl-3-phosphoglycerate phosphatase
MRLILTDLDGTLIDHHTYSSDAARPALAAAQAAAVPVVPCSSKTLAEMRGLAASLGLIPAPLIVENGGAIWFPGTWPRLPAQATPLPEGGSVLALGPRVEWLRPRLDELAASLGLHVRGFSGMDDAEVAGRTGLSLAAAAQARQRQYSEPFVCDSEAPDLTILDDAARRLGARVTRGGRFFHLTGHADKGAAVRVVLGTCPAGTRTLGLGDAPNDLSLLAAVDDAVIVPQSSGGLHPDLVRALPAALHAPAPGPVGWNAMVLQWLDEPVRR